MAGDLEPQNEQLLYMSTRIKDLQTLLEKSEVREAALQERLAAYEEAITEATLSLKAIGEPDLNTPPNAKICAIIARLALARVKDALPEGLRPATVAMLLKESAE